MVKPLAVLIVEDNKSDAQLLVRMLTKAGYTLTYEHVDTGPQMLAALEKQTWDIVISDFSMPELDGHASLKILQETGLDIPFIVVSGTMGEETAVAMMKAGAHDYVMKGNLARLVPAVERELNQAKLRLERKQAEEELDESEEKFRKSMEFTPIPTAVAKNNGDLVFLNKHFIDTYGYTLQDLPTIETWFVLAYPDIEYRNYVLNDWGKRVADAIKNNTATLAAAYFATCKNGAVKTVEISAYFEKDFSIGLFQDITERKQAEDALRESEELFSFFLKHSPIYAYIKTVTPSESRNLKISDNYQDLLGFPASEMVGKTNEDLFPADFAAKMTADDWAVVSNGVVLNLDEDFNGRHYSSIKFPITQGDKTLLAGYSIDITERKQAEAQREAAFEALQKKIDELERWQSLTVGRELMMIELKKEINALLEQIGQPQKYKIADGTR